MTNQKEQNIDIVERAKEAVKRTQTTGCTTVGDWFSDKTIEAIVRAALSVLPSRAPEVPDEVREAAQWLVNYLDGANLGIVDRRALPVARALLALSPASKGEANPPAEGK